MRIAIVCDDLIQFGGAEKMVLAVSEIWPDAPVYTSVASKKWQKICAEKGIVLRTSFMKNLPYFEKLNRYYSPFLLHCLAFESFNFNDFDIVLSMSARFAHGVITQPQTKHICYMHSPGRMIWESDGYFEKESFGFLNFLRILARPFLSLGLYILRQWDYTAAQRVDFFVANSKTPKKRIKKYYGIIADVIYPCVDIVWDVFADAPEKSLGYFLVVSRLQSWKRIDIAVEACSRLNLPLKVIGGGPDLARLKKLAGSCVEFLGPADDNVKKKLLEGCKALIQTQKEDFGIVPLEALSVGKPVIAFGQGGALETVAQGKTGEFFYEQTADSLADLLQKFDPTKYDPKICVESTKKFSKENFTKNIQEYVNKVYLMSSDPKAL